MAIPSHLETFDMKFPIWDRVFMVFPLVVIGSKEEDGTFDLAPKHMAMPMGWGNYFGFVCTPRHSTYDNIQREKSFTVNFPKPSEWLATSLAAAPRCDDGKKYSLRALETFHSERIEGIFVSDCYIYLECNLDRIVDGFGVNSLIVGKISTSHIDKSALRNVEVDDHDLIYNLPLLSYLHPGRFTEISGSKSFPFPEGMKK